MSIRHDVRLLPVNLWDFVDQEVPLAGIRQEWDAGKYLMRSHDDMRPILRTCQIFRELVGHVPTNRITMKNLHRGRIGELSELLNPRFFDQQFGWLQQQHV